MPLLVPAQILGFGFHPLAARNGGDTSPLMPALCLGCEQTAAKYGESCDVKLPYRAALVAF
eukprot:m.226355 g.226355  ORF g.226355 m.226355 type:complete len:61 (-) comp15169_c0_seq10:2087-2269(-)